MTAEAIATGACDAGRPGTIHTMSTTPDRHGSDAMAGPHGAGDHGANHGNGDHGHPDDGVLGPVHLAAWAAGALGIALGLVVAGALALAAGWIG